MTKPETKETIVEKDEVKKPAVTPAPAPKPGF